MKFLFFTINLVWNQYTAVRLSGTGAIVFLALPISQIHIAAKTMFIDLDLAPQLFIFKNIDPALPVDRF